MLCCKIIKNHIDEVKIIVDKAKKNHQKIDVEKFKSTHICSIKTPEGEIPLSLSDIEKQYCNHFPDWDKKNQCFPEGPIFYDSLFKKSLLLGSLILKTEGKNLERRLKLYQKFHLLPKMAVVMILLNNCQPLFYKVYSLLLVN